MQATERTPLVHGAGVAKLADAQDSRSRKERVGSSPTGPSWVDVRPKLVPRSGQMSTRRTKERLALLQGTLDLLILRTLAFGPRHGQGVARAIQQSSYDELLVDHGALYPALQRLEDRGWIAATWGVSENNRKARFYSLTGTGRRRLARERSRWERLPAAIARVLGPEEA